MLPVKLSTTETPLQTSVPAFNCSEDGVQIVSGCYWLGSEPNGITWSEAEGKCQEQGGTLAVFDRQQDLTYINSLLGLGLTRSGLY